MKKLLAVILAIVIWFIAFGIVAAIEAAILSALVSSGWNPSPGISIVLALFLGLLKWGLSIWAGVKGYKMLKKRWLASFVKE